MFLVKFLSTPRPDPDRAPDPPIPRISPVQTIRADVSQFLRVAEERHRRGEEAMRVVQGLSDGIDGILRHLYAQVLEEHQEAFAMVAIGGYGRRELCPYSDIDLLFLTTKQSPSRRLERFVRDLWDGGFQLGHSVRTPQDCFRFMVDDHVTAAALLENRFVAGSRTLYERFTGVALNRFRKRRGEEFAGTKLDQLRQSLEGKDRTIWVLEPHLKEGCAALRDLQRVLWVENIRRGHRTFADIAKGGNFEADSVAALERAYSFYLRVRCELHFRNKVKQDILERDSVVEVARGVGYEGSRRDVAEGLMADYFRHARESVRFLRRYLETDTRGKRFFAKLSHKFFGSAPKPYLHVADGVLFPAGSVPVVEPGLEEALAAEILDIFLLAQRDGLRLSETLTRMIRRRVDAMAFDFAHSPVAVACFLEILMGQRDVGLIVDAMHRAGLLTRILPEFGSIDGKVSFGGHHQFTVDAHTLRALAELDRVEAGDESIPEEFRRVVRSIPDRFPLRVALLLHDIGKGLPDGDHSVTGSEASQLICERLGIESDVVELIEFLIYRHLAMFRVSERHDFTEEGVAESFARLVGSEERLGMLYLLTYIDVSSVGPGTWTSWKGAQLAELYERVRACLRDGEPRVASLEETLEASNLDAESRALVLEHLRHVEDVSSIRDVVPERLLAHARLIREFDRSGATQVGFESFGGYHELLVACADRAHLFADIAGVLFAEGLNLLGARILSRDDARVIDVFWVEVVDEVRIDMQRRVDAITKKLRSIDAKEIAVEDLIRAWVRTHRFRKLRRRRLPLYAPTVQFDNETSDACTLIEVVAPDRPGLLYDLASGISRLGLDVRTAKVSTLADRCRDTFYVRETDGQKVMNPARRKQIEQALIEEIRSPTSALAEGGAGDVIEF